MKQITLPLIIAAGLAFGLVGCGQNETATPATKGANKAEASAADAAARTAEAAKVEAEKTAAAAKTEAAKVADTAKAEAAKVADAAKDQAEKAADDAKAAARKAEAAKAASLAKTQGLVDQVRTLIAEGKLSEASSVIQQLAGQTLSADQTKIVESLKQQIEKALVAKASDKAAGDAGNLLKK